MTALSEQHVRIALASLNQTARRGDDEATTEALWHLAEAVRHHLASPDDREHIVELNAGAVANLAKFLARPNGAFGCGRVMFEAVASGGILVRTAPYRTPEPDRAAGPETPEYCQRADQVETCHLNPGHTGDCWSADGEPAPSPDQED